MLNHEFSEKVSATETTEDYSGSQLVRRTEKKITCSRDYRANNSITKSNYLKKLGNWFKWITSFIAFFKLLLNGFNNCNQPPVWSL